MGTAIYLASWAGKVTIEYDAIMDACCHLLLTNSGGAARTYFDSRGLSDAT